MKLNALNAYLSELLQPQRFTDYCPNGLQVEGRAEVHKIVTGVTASLDLLQAAAQAGADAILVHHGYFWRGEDSAVTGIKKRRLQFLLQHDINLFAYHLPLDAHTELGNNVMLGKQLGLKISGYLDDKNMLPYTELEKPIALQALSDEASGALNRTPQMVGDPEKQVKTIAWCTGAAQGYIDQAIAKQMDVFISGEISEQTVHSVRESATAYLAAGHHATERYGIAALGQHLAEKWGLSHQFIDIDNPV